MISCQLAASASSIKSSKTSLYRPPSRSRYRKVSRTENHYPSRTEECVRLTTMTESGVGIGASSDRLHDEDLYELPPPPDGGYGWVIVIVSFVCNAVVDGIVYSFGRFQKRLADDFRQPEGKVALIGSLLSGIYMLDGPLVSAVSNKFGTRISIIIGAVVGATGLALSTRATSAGDMMMSYGFISGIGFGFIYLPAVVFVSYYFEKRRSLATGIAVCGSGFGIIVMTPFVDFLLDKYQWRTTNLILAGIVSSCIILSVFMVPLKYKKIRKVKPPINVDPGVHSVLSLNELAPNTTIAMSTVTQMKIVQEGKNGRDGIEEDIFGKNTPLGAGTEIRVGNLARNQSQPTFTTYMQGMQKNDSLPFYDCTRKFSVGERYRPSLDQIRASRTNMSSNDDIKKLVQIKVANASIVASKRNNVGGMWSRTDLDSECERNVASREKPGIVRPMSRKDIFYTGSVVKLSEFQSQKSLQSYRQSVLSIPRSREKENWGNTYDEKESSSCCSSCKFSHSFKSVLSSMLSVTLLKDPVFVMIALSSFFSMSGIFIPFAYIERAAEKKNIAKATEELITSMIGISNTVGRILLGQICDSPRVNALYVNNICLTICSISAFAFPFCNQFWHFMVSASLYGFGCAGFMALTSIYLAEIFGLDKLTSSFGLLIMFRGAGGLSGPPLAATAFDATQNVDNPFYITSLYFLIGSFFNLLVPVVKYCRSPKIPKPSNDYLAPINEDEEEEYENESKEGDSDDITNNSNKYSKTDEKEDKRHTENEKNNELISLSKELRTNISEVSESDEVHPKAVENISSV